MDEPSDSSGTSYISNFIRCRFCDSLMQGFSFCSWDSLAYSDPIRRFLSRVRLHLWSPSSPYRNKDPAAMIPFTHLRQLSCLKHLKPERQVSAGIQQQRCLRMKGSTRLNWTTKTRRRRMMERRKKWAKSSLRRRPSRQWPGGSANTSSPTSPSNLSCSSMGLSGGFASIEDHSVQQHLSSGVLIEWPQVS